MKPMSEPPDTIVADVDEDAPTLVFKPTVVDQTVLSEPPEFLTAGERLSDLAARVKRRTEERDRG